VLEGLKYKWNIKYIWDIMKRHILWIILCRRRRGVTN
jgi:hypothetical protein